MRNYPSKIEAVKNWEAPRTSSREEAFQILMDKLCNAPVLALPDGPKDFVVYYDASGLGLELFSDYDCEIRYHHGKANIVADALTTQNEAVEVINALAEMLRGLDKQMKRRSDGAWYYLDRIWVPLMGDVRTLIMDKAHKSKYS
ncbi:putative reverse transcriptase domain-containing protein, partial [Tanacetum coccineum]